MKKKAVSILNEASPHRPYHRRTMPPPNNPPPVVVNDAASMTTTKPPPPPPEESRFEAALCLMNLQRPLENPDPSSTKTPPLPQRNEAVVGSMNNNNNGASSLQPIKVVPFNNHTANTVAPFHMGATNPNPPPPTNNTTTNNTTTSTTGPPQKKKRVRLNYICTQPGCTNLVRKGGVCIRHGAEVKLCSYPHCKNHAKNGGVCRRHGASRPCGRNGCNNMVVKQGLCIKHWREENTTNNANPEYNLMQEKEEREREMAVAAMLAAGQTTTWE